MTTRTYRTKHSRSDIQRALQDMERLYAPTERERIERRFMSAKAAYTEATEALIRQEPGAAERADAALAVLNAARAELRRLDGANECDG